MLDPAILFPLERLMPPNPPPMALGRLRLDQCSEPLKRVATALVNLYVARLDAWSSDVATIKRRIEFADSRPRSAADLAPLSQMIEDVEALSEYQGALIACSRQAAIAEIDKALAVDPPLAAARRSTIQTLIERDDAIVDQLLDLALILRAYRAANSLDATGGPAFSDPDALAQFLSDATA